MIDPLQTEATLAAIGIEPILRASPKFGVAQSDAAASMQKRIRAAILKFMGGGEERSEPPAFSYDEVSELLEADDDEVLARVQALSPLLDAELADEVEGHASHVISGMQAGIPTRQWASTTKVHEEPPEAFAQERYERRWAVANDPMSVFSSLLDGTIDQVSVAALAEFYPALYAFTLRTVDEAIATMKTRRGDAWESDPERERDLRVLIQAPTVSAELGADFAQYAQSVAAPQPRANPRTIKIDSEALPGQRG